jgi:ssDNA-binding Zn-finger/Zn-ribbon topoisomerase 1
VSWPTCDCGHPLVLRTRRADGHQFYGCSTYPACTQTFENDGYFDEVTGKHFDPSNGDPGNDFDPPPRDWGDL